MVDPSHRSSPTSADPRSTSLAVAPRPNTPSSVVVPIRSIGPGQIDRIESHLLSLAPQDRYLRFGYAANDEQIRRYVAQLNFERDEVFGIFNRRLELIAMAHLAFSVDPQYNSCAEFGVSVAKGARGRGYGGRLFERAVMHARNEGVAMLFIHALSENTAMLKIARRAGAVIERDGSESEAHLRLPPADFDSRVTELFNQQVAVTDYHLKAQAHQFWGFLGILQEIRRGVRDARDRVRG
ncbi:GNAT family N-acetyltransferase [Hydrogenophaga sp.]|uniref:GNAT family N-acetyltransferase n=1 Tax=Hydrogenophaga sp. TaxID=1904254 RepID=UPI002728669B|nr:GNAT family N-acetyltransferase [Hydrogenophaga sp.]MDO9435887.1 GNAT family N-acetyltransferase [Hydrogenophaga sp.]